MDRFNFLKERDFVYQVSDEIILKNILNNPKSRSFYIGIDPTADSLHIGHLSGVMVAIKLAEYGLQPIIVLGGGTALIGDPSGKTEMRKLIDDDQINQNIKGIEAQLLNLFPKNVKPIFLNNASWLKDLSMIDYLREIGRHFSINRMLSQDCVKTRLEAGISYLEFSYMILQSYDFVYLNKKYNCELQIGGADQWGNMVMGIDLVRKLNQKESVCFTFPLITNASGEKMGKTAKGAVWLDSNKFSSYDYYQYWINIDDADLIKLMSRYTFVEAEQILKYSKLEGKEINIAKQILAFEATKIVHGEEEANKAKTRSESLFSSEKNVEELEGINYSFIGGSVFLLDLLKDLKLASSKTDARRLIEAGAVYLDENRISDFNFVIKMDELSKKYFLLRVGKKKYLKINIG